MEYRGSERTSGENGAQLQVVFLFAFSSFVPLFRLPKAEKTHEISESTSLGTLCLNFGYSLSKRYKFVDYLKIQKFSCQK
jgi:hypothetical protein